MRILLLSLVLLFFTLPVNSQESFGNSLEDEIQRRMEQYSENNITVAQDILNKYINGQVMGAILEKETGSPIRLVDPSDANMAVLTAAFDECKASMMQSMRLHQSQIMEVRLIEYGMKGNPNSANYDEFVISLMFHESVPNALVSICLKNKTTTPSTTFIVFNAVVEGLIVQTYKNRYKI